MRCGKFDAICGHVDGIVDIFAVGVNGYEGDWLIGEQVAIEQNGEITAVGVAKMNPEEMISMNRGIAVEVRHHA